MASGFSLARRVLPCFLFCVIWFVVVPTRARGQGESPQAPAPSNASQPESKQNTEELASHDEPATFKVNVKLVVVRAVIRDAEGHAVGNLRKEDFQAFDKGKLQVITQFEVEQPGALVAKARQNSEESAEQPADIPPSNSAGAPAAPERFVAFLFDDVHLEFGDLAQTRAAAERHLSSLRPTDRAAIFTTSGLTTLDFTDDRAKLREALIRLQPHPISSGIRHDCPEVSYYQADLIVNKNDPQARQLAEQEAARCEPTNLQGVPMANPAATVSAVSAC